MSMNNPYSQYSLNQINTATPGKLLIMTFDAAIRFARTAAVTMKEHKLYEQNENIKKIQNILLDLISTLNPQVDSQLAANLSSIYSYMFDRLTHANMRDDITALNEVIEMLKELRTTWADAELIVRSGESETILEAKAA
ncbi:MAG: flagellar export chaperone FliS [Armatimonadota bacterium]